MEIPRIRTFSHYCRQKFGAPVGKIPLDLGIPCPNRSAGGCVYCSAAAFSPGYLGQKGDVADQLERGKKYLLKGRFKKYFAYFQQETPTAMHPQPLLAVLKKVLHDIDCVGLIISTRPDYLDKTFLGSLDQYINKCGKGCLVELGLQSAKPVSLEYLNRNHSYADFLGAFRLLRSFESFEVGVHLLFGIPGESEEDMISSVLSVCGLGVDALKLHHLQVLKDTALARIYKQGDVELFSKEQYLAFLLKILPLIPGNVVIHRLWATAHPQMLIAPRWNLLATELSSVLRQMMEENDIWQGNSCHYSSK